MRIVNARVMRLRPRGTLLLELTVSLMVIGTVMLLMAQLVVSREAMKRNLECRQWAVQEAANILEHATIQPWARRPDGEVAEQLAQAHTERVAEALPDGSLSIVVDRPEGELDLVRVQVEIRWNGSPGVPVRPVRLVTWIRRQPEEDAQ